MRACTCPCHMDELVYCEQCCDGPAPDAALLARAPTDLLTEIVRRCKCAVSITVNQHRNYYQSVETYLDDADRLSEIAPKVLAEMQARNTVVEVQAYPNTPVGFYCVAHYDLTAALRDLLSALEGRR